MRRRTLFAFLLSLAVLLPDASSAQDGLESVCSRVEVQAIGGGGGSDACFATVQALTSAQPMLGILIAGGNPTLGSSGEGGFRLGLFPAVSAGLRLNVVPVRVPDILADQASGAIGSLTRRLGVPVPAISGDLSIGLFDGFSIAPTLGGIGGISLLGNASYLPFELFDSEGFDEADLAYGFGARLHLLDESFVVPGLSLSLMRRSLPEVGFGNVCRGETLTFEIPGSSPPTQATGCTADGDAGEFSFDLTDWSTRLVASKRLLGFGATIGVGHDRFSSDLGFGFRGENIPTTDVAPIFRVTDEELSSSRWAVFGSLGYTLLVGTLGVEAGWQQGDSPIGGFDDLGADFDPGDGAWFGSIGARLSL